MSTALRGTAVLLAGVAAPLLLAGCGNSAGDLTCQEYQAQSITDQTDTLRDLLNEHDLESGDVGNVQGVTAAVTSLCSSNSSATLDDATDWDSDTW
jgi:hypothetical protein